MSGHHNELKVRVDPDERTESARRASFDPAADRHAAPGAPLLSVHDLSISFDTPSAVVRAVNSVSFSLERGKTLGIVGESGSGKSVVARAIMGLTPRPPGRIDGGSIYFDGADLLTLRPQEMRAVRGERIAMVFQDPMRSLNPTMRIGDQIAEGLRARRRMPRRAARAQALELLHSVQIPAPLQRIDSYPHELSGGMRQRVMIAIALACEPDLLIADEPTTALDVTVQAQILDLLADLQRELGMSLILITHDLGVAAWHTDDIAVMYGGRVVERSSTKELFRSMRMPYTRALFDSIPRMDVPPHQLLAAIPGRPPDPANFPAGCSFNPRCPRVVDRCHSERPELVEGAPGHEWACWRPIGTEEVDDGR